MRLHAEVATLKETEASLKGMHDLMHESLVIERNELMTRVQKIDARIRALGRTPPEMK